MQLKGKCDWVELAFLANPTIYPHLLMLFAKLKMETLHMNAQNYIQTENQPIQTPILPSAEQSHIQQSTEVSTNQNMQADF